MERASRSGKPETRHFAFGGMLTCCKCFSDLQASQVALAVKNLPASAGEARDEGSVPALGRSPGGGSGNPLQYSCLENPLDKEPGVLPSMGSQRVGHN